MKRLFSLILVFCMICSFGVLLSGCGYTYADLDLRAEYTKEFAGTTLNVYNWGEYISDGSDDSIDTIKEFEHITGIKVNYSTFDSNETMYSQIKNGGVSYDIIIPSDYMIERLINEDMLLKLDRSKLTNFDLIDNKYKGLYFDPKDEYTAAYCVGMVGLIYNTKKVKEAPDSWHVLWDRKYKDDILMFNNPRDAFAIAQFMLEQDLNSTNKKDWDKAAELLKKQKKYLQSYVMDEVYGKMETGEAALAPYYAGDFLTMWENNDDLAFVYPKEGTNIFVDSACIPKNAQNYEAALMFINFLMEPDIALANAEYIGYASPNTAVVNNENYYYYGNKILYPDEADMPKTQYFHNIDKDIRLILRFCRLLIARSRNVHSAI